MKVIRMDLNEIEQLEDLAACIGYFDGMHVGHMRLIEKTLEQLTLILFLSRTSIS